jgi:DNA repair exonuclease SbcCD ATPase subunit
MKKLEILKKKRNNLKRKIRDLEADVKQRKQSNADLLSRNWHKQKKPKSLTIQRHKIIELDLSLEEHKNALEATERKIQVEEEQLRKKDLQKTLKSIAENSELEQSLYNRVNSLLEEVKSIVVQIERSQKSGKHPLRTLINLISKAGLESLAVLGFNAEGFTKSWHQTRIEYQTFNPEACRAVYASKMNLLLELESKLQGKRGFHKYEPPKPTIQTPKAVPSHYDGRHIKEQQERSLENYRRMIRVKPRFVTQIHK